MNIEKRFSEITLFLKDYSELINTEVLTYSTQTPAKFDTWIEQIKSLPLKQRLELENELCSQEITTFEYRDYLQTIKRLQNIEKLDGSSFSIPKEMGRKISAKKKHEIVQIQHYLEKKEFNTIVDIGSGAGHLSSLLINKNTKQALCLDQEEKFQRIGKEKLERFAPEILDRLTFKKVMIDNRTQLPLTKDTLLLGLHSCGDLSVDLIKSFASSKQGSLLNYGCCYHKLSPEKIYLSHFSKSHRFDLSSFALNLAAKSYKTVSELDADKRKRVKNFRYALHILNSSLKLAPLKSVGNGLKSDYEMSFNNYVKKFAPHIYELKSDQELIDFFNSSKTQNKIEDFLALGLIRNQIGRLIELYLILDRAIYLKESGLKVELKESFDPSLSPRNIALYAWSL